MNTELAKRAVACKHWRWMPGMSISDGLLHDRICTAWEDGKLEVRDMYIHDASEWLPDLTDPATLGCLLALVREAYKERCLNAVCLSDTPDGQLWGVRSYGRALGTYMLPSDPEDGPTEAAALVAALEAAP
jgi:hypothetical protein